MSEEARLDERTALSLKGVGITILGVIISVGATVGFGLGGPWWLRVASGLAVTLALVLVVKVASRGRRGPLTRLANWIIGAPNP
jgi:hypothetical protein